jgi:hypothetical protein
MSNWLRFAAGVLAPTGHSGGVVPLREHFRKEIPMKSLTRFLAAVIFLTVVMSLSSSASSLLCSASPTAKLTDNGSYQVIYTCTIAANTVATNKAIRFTFGIGAQSANDGDYEMYFNGVAIGGGGITLEQNYFQLMIMNTGSTAGEILGIVPNPDATSYAGGGGIEDGGGSSLSGLKWSGAQTLVIQVYPLTGWVQGQMFIVELVD